MSAEPVVYDIATPYTAVFLIFQKDGKLAFLLRENTDWMSGHYGLVQGKVEKDESAKVAAIREAAEEVGVTVREADLKHVLTVHRDSQDSVWIDLVFEVTTWQGEAYNTEPQKHAELAWLDPNNLPDNVIPILIDYLNEIKAGGTYFELGWKE